MADNWDDGSDDDWDVSDDDLDARLNANAKANGQEIPKFDDEVDLAVKEKAERERLSKLTLQKKGNALAEKKAADAARKEELELARRAMELEAEAEANLSPDELAKLKRQQVEEADHALTADLFGGGKASAASTTTANTQQLALKDMKDHLKHARTVATALRSHGKIHLSAAFFRECLTQSSAVLDDDAVSDLIKTLNVMKNEKVAASKRKVKGQAQKSKKQDKAAVEKARKLVETFGDNDQYDDYDQVGEDYEDAFF